MMQLPPIDRAELNTILAALRHYQATKQGDPFMRSQEIHDLATDNDSDISLDADAIDDLAERINCEAREAPPPLVHATGAFRKHDDSPLADRLARCLLQQTGRYLDTYGESLDDVPGHIAEACKALQDAGRPVMAPEQLAQFDQPRYHYRAAVDHLREARRLLKGAPKARAKVKKALTSAQGAVRHADGLADRERSAQP